jgi:hypothetical protein
MRRCSLVVAIIFATLGCSRSDDQPGALAPTAKQDALPATPLAVTAAPSVPAPPQPPAPEIMGPPRPDDAPRTKTPTKEQEEALRQRSLKLEFGLLGTADQKRLRSIAQELEGDQYLFLEAGVDPTGADLPVHFIRAHRNFFESAGAKAALARWAKHANVDAFLENMKLENRPDVETLKIEFALLPPSLDKEGHVDREGKQYAVEISAKIKGGGLDSLSDEEKEFVKANQVVFMPAK